MIRHIFKSYHFVLAAVMLASLALGACSDNMSAPESSVKNAGVISLTLRSAKTASRAVEDDVDALNENLITSAYLFFYPENNPNDKPLFIEYITDINKTTTATVEVALDRDTKDALFPPETDRCCVYVIANPSSGMPRLEDLKNMTFDDIRQLAVSADFATSTVQPSFTMDGESVPVYNADGNLIGGGVKIENRGTTSESASGAVQLTRCASKITLAVNVEEKLEIRDDEDNVVETWTAQLSNMSVLITDGVQRSQLASLSYTPDSDTDYYSTTLSNVDEYKRARRLQPQSSSEFPYILQAPFYTFPTKWNAADYNSRQLYMTLMVPWKKNDEESYRTCYYTVPVVRPDQDTRQVEIGRNVSYRVNLYVSMLGSFSPQEPFELTPLSYYAVDWGTVSTDVDIADTRYLVVDQTAYTLNNEQSIDIPVYTSHETVVTSKTMRYFLYNTFSRGIEQPIEITETRLQNTIDEGQGEIYTCEFHNATAAEPSNYLNFDHPMLTWTPFNSDGREVVFPVTTADAGYTIEQTATRRVNSIAYYEPTNNPAYSRYITTITIAHKDRPEYSQTLTITQYPQMYISSTANYFPTTGNATPQQGNVFVNGSNSTNTGWYQLYSLGSQGNSNPNQYVITITQLNPGEDYVIGDPRVSTYTNLNGWKNNFGNNGQTAPNNNWVQANDMVGTRRRLTYYYPTDESAAKARWIAPSFRIASSYGVCPNANNYDQDKARCASYQELSRPAGRWRMPTVAEMEYIMKLSQQGKIPALFSGSAYMTAQGYTSTTFNEEGKLTTPTTKSGNTAVRCVYDEWYWGNDTIVPGTNGRYTFTWGDRERTAVDPKP